MDIERLPVSAGWHSLQLTSLPGIKECIPVNFETGKDILEIRRTTIPIPKSIIFRIFTFFLLLVNNFN